MKFETSLQTESDAKEEVARDQEDDLFAVMNPLVLHHEIGDARKVRHGDDHEVNRKTCQGVGHDAHDATLEE